MKVGKRMSNKKVQHIVQFVCALGFILLWAVAGSLCFAQEGQGEISLTTYYPAPYGEFKMLRLSPTNHATDPDLAPGKIAEGDMYYNEDDDIIYAYDGSNWQEVGGDSYWTLSGNDLYPEPTLGVDYVGIGTLDPDYALHVGGKFKAHNIAAIHLGGLPTCCTIGRFCHQTPQCIQCDYTIPFGRTFDRPPIVMCNAGPRVRLDTDPRGLPHCRQNPHGGVMCSIRSVTRTNVTVGIGTTRYVSSPMVGDKWVQIIAIEATE
ncbi:MAG: hypothetical protein JSW40_00075 [Candidatus Omnitrophota bacterium]|nr:MAG: hypothetical protein JSW40_00075 [Candidatus Omnitrophota bacterium]